jgi:peroxiredoxin Q/BCP
MKWLDRPPGSKGTLARTAVLVCLFLILIGVSSAFALEVGQVAPDFRLKSTTGKPVALGEYRGSKNVVVQFYVLDFTPG